MKVRWEFVSAAAASQPLYTSLAETYRDMDGGLCSLAFPRPLVARPRQGISLQGCSCRLGSIPAHFATYEFGCIRTVQIREAFSLLARSLVTAMVLAARPRPSSMGAGMSDHTS